MQDLAKTMVLTFGQGIAPDIDDIARTGAHGNSPANCQRDLLGLIGELKAPDPYVVKTKVIQTSDTVTRVDTCDTYIFLPHDWVACLAEH